MVTAETTKEFVDEVREAFMTDPRFAKLKLTRVNSTQGEFHNEFVRVEIYPKSARSWLTSTEVRIQVGTWMYGADIRKVTYTAKREAASGLLDKAFAKAEAVTEQLKARGRRQKAAEREKREGNARIRATAEPMFADFKFQRDDYGRDGIYAEREDVELIFSESYQDKLVSVKIKCLPRLTVTQAKRLVDFVAELEKENG